MKGVADRTLELMNEYQADLDHKSWRTFQHFLVVNIEQLEDENKSLLKIKAAAKMYLEHGEPELADELDAILKEQTNA